jgi:16S rRNA (cytidine1402-2'-O)-methyltransferase
MSGTLYLLPTVISEETLASVIPAEVRAKACQIDHFLVEAAKTARHYLKDLGHPKPIASLSIVEIGHEPDPAKIDEWLAPLREGHDMAIVSESGCPGVADPGAQIVARVQADGGRVVPLVGPSSLLLTLMGSGLDGQHFRFTGYLPIADADRREALLSLERESARGETILFIETPYRNRTMLESLLEVLRPDTRLCVAQDVTGKNESIRTKTIAAWKAASEDERELLKIPTVFAFLAAPHRTQAKAKSAFRPSATARRSETMGEDSRARTGGHGTGRSARSGAFRKNRTR